MDDPDDTAYRHRYRAAGDEVLVREPEEVDDDAEVFELRMPIASTGQVRNEDDNPLTRDELNGMARQLNDRQIGVFPAHGGGTKIAGSRYSPFERLGDWHSASIDSREDENVLMATARMPDPETLPAATGDYREGLAILKEQATRGIAQDASIGWRDDESFPGGVDLMEASIVGIGADWRTNTGDEAAEVVARAAVEAGADPDALVATVERAVDEQTDMADDDTGDEAGTADGEQDASDGETTERAEAPAWASELRDLLESIHDAVREDDGDDDEDEDDEEENEGGDDDEDDDEDEQSADTDGEQSADGDDADGERDLEEQVEELRAELADVRANGGVETPGDDGGERDADDADADGADAEDETERDADTGASVTDGLGDYR